MKNIALIILVTFSLCACASRPKPLPTASSVNIERYIGKWHTISSLPQFFTRGCKGQTADYGIINPQTISVLNTCLKKDSKKTISGQAVVVNAATNAELEVTFNSFFTRLFRVKGDYTIIKLDEDYRYVLVGSKDRESLWILARETRMPQSVYDSYVEFARVNGFPTSKLVKSEF